MERYRIEAMRNGLPFTTAERDELLLLALRAIDADTEIARLRAELAEARRLVDRLRMEADRSDDHCDEALAERDAARRERDARPEISPEDAALYIAHCNGVPYSRTPADERAKAIAEMIGFERVEAALRAHAARAGKDGSDA